MIEFSDALEQASAVRDRFEALLPTRVLPINWNSRAYLMDLLAADGRNGNLPIDWRALLAFDDDEFLHDAAGIYRHLNRETGVLDGGFVPRSAVWRVSAGKGVH